MVSGCRVGVGGGLLGIQVEREDWHWRLLGLDLQLALSLF